MGEVICVLCTKEVMPLRAALSLKRIWVPILHRLFSVYLSRFGPSFKKRFAIRFAHVVFHHSTLIGTKFEIDAHRIEITSDFLDIIKALTRREGNNFRVIATTGQQGTQELAKVCFMRGIEYEERS